MIIFPSGLFQKGKFCMSEQFKDLREDILNEKKLLEEVLRHLRQIKSNFPINKEDHTTEPAIGAYLMNFYNGIENILKRISKVYYKAFPTGPSWHKELLELSYQPPEKKLAVFSKQTVSCLYEYKNFRHRFVSGYGFQLKIEKMIELINGVEGLWKDIDRELNIFIKKL